MSAHVSKSEPSPDRAAPALSGPPTPSQSPNPSRRSGRVSRLAGGLVTSVVVLAALGIGIGLGRSLLAPEGGGDGGGEAGAASPGASAATVWTCSMHPQIRQPNPGDCPLCGMDLIPATDDGGEEAEGLREVSISREARELLDLKVEPVERRYVTATVRMVGKVDYDETRLGYITAWVPGRLDRLFVDYTGVEVQEGDHLVSIYSPELYSAQAELIRARQAAQERRSSSGVLGAERLLESAREKLRLWGLTEAQIQEIEAQQEPSDHLTIYAPMSGIVIQKNLQEGAYVETGTRIYTISDLSRLWVKLDAYESDLPWLRYGQEVEFTSEAYPGEVFTGTIAFIDPVLNAATRTVKVRVNVPNPSGKLKPDMFVRAVVRAQVATAGRVMDAALVGKWICRMHPGVVKDIAGDCDVCGMPLVRTETLGYVSAAAAADESAEPLVVPASAVLKTGTRAVVYVERPNADRPTYEGREIVLGPRAGDSYIVRAGLEEGERVVTQGNFKLDSALQIAAKPSMMNPEGAMADAGSDGGGDQLALPPSVAGQLGRVLSAAGEAASAMDSGDREAMRAALQSLEQAIAGVDAEKLDGHAAMLWKELAMQLRNDAVEGRWAASDRRIRDAVGQLMTDIGRLRDRFGVTDDPGTLLANGPFDVSNTFREQLTGLWNAYQNAQQALAGDDPDRARSAVDQAEEALSSIDMTLLEGEAHDAWMTTRGELLAAIEPLQQANDLEALRGGFKSWSETMLTVVSSFGLPTSVGPISQHFCSMAFDNKGAAWLQADGAVRNPYFGATMLTCATDTSLIWDGPPAETVGPRPVEAPPAFREQLKALWNAYLQAQDTLASDDPARAGEAAGALDRALAGIDASALESEARETWEREQANLRTAIDRMAGAAGIEPLRAGFALLSEEMPVILETFAPEIGGDVYRMHCPMAFDGRGAAWLQAGEQPRNPYYGATMLRCVDEVQRVALGDSARDSEEGHDHD
ncbi:efflux RND transporter periplasmic adaptor subunit [Tautonia marina]|uniref:efflux RND transporter periplasmic adaptor subunit n=1 Tax=Tautonia marina TaxID=2653855 RepID=UPI00191BFDF8|nr:efflux RND transporter periplasmic adaptor subunit [Tautonia marina]